MDTQAQPAVPSRTNQCPGSDVQSEQATQLNIQQRVLLTALS
jgi:hypothetical protein